jgi:hypothetical protein
MAILELDTPQVDKVDVAQVDLVLAPNPEWQQDAAHAHISLIYGQDVDGAMVERYRESIYFRDEEFAQFVAAFADLKARFLAEVMRIKGMQGVVR